MEARETWTPAVTLPVGVTFRQCFFYVTFKEHVIYTLFNV